MTTAADDETCPYCKGRGEVGTGRREWETGVWETETCPFCRGDGCVSAEGARALAKLPPHEPGRFGWI